MKNRVFISFDYDHDVKVKDLLVGQARLNDSPFEIVDMSIKETINSNWKANARRRIKSCDVVIVLCGMYTDSATGVTAEMKIAQEEGIPYFLLQAYSDYSCCKPIGTRSNDKMYNWTWQNLKLLIAGNR